MCCPEKKSLGDYQDLFESAFSILNGNNNETGPQISSDYLTLGGRNIGDFFLALKILFYFYKASYNEHIVFLKLDFKGLPKIRHFFRK